MLSVSAQTKVSWMPLVAVAWGLSDSKLQLNRERERGINFSVLTADGRLSTAICRLDGRDGFVPSEDSFLPSAGSEETTIMMNIWTKMKVKQKQTLSRPARRELKLAHAKMKNVFQSCTLMAAVAFFSRFYFLFEKYGGEYGEDCGWCLVFESEWPACGGIGDQRGTPWGAPRCAGASY